MSWVSTRVNAHKRFRLRLLPQSPVGSGSAGPRPRKRLLAKWCIDIGVRSERMTMGLLDDLKKQAALVKTQQILQQNLRGLHQVRLFFQVVKKAHCHPLASNSDIYTPFCQQAFAGSRSGAARLDWRL